MSNWRLYLLCSVMVGVLGFLQYRLWFETGGIRDLLHLKRTLAQQAQMNDQLKTRNEELLAQIKSLQSSQDAAESRAREELGMIKKDEKFYQIVSGSH